MIICNSGAIPEQRNLPAILSIYPRKLGGKPEKYHLSPCGIPASEAPYRERERERVHGRQKKALGRSVGATFQWNPSPFLPFLLFFCRPPADDLYIYTTCVYERETRLCVGGMLNNIAMRGQLSSGGEKWMVGFGRGSEGRKIVACSRFLLKPLS